MYFHIHDYNTFRPLQLYCRAYEYAWQYSVRLITYHHVYSYTQQYNRFV